MDQRKIGKFIARCRKNVNLTQLQLAEQLGITDRAVSKWETGKALPDSSIMLQLCDVLGITVNDLLSGEVVSMENYSKELESKLLEMVRQKEESDRRLLALEWVIGILSMLVLLIPIIIASFVPMDDRLQTLLCFCGMIPCLIGFGFALKIEQVAGYYECRHCHHRYVPTFKAVNFAPHIGRTRHMKCPECGEKSWQKKVIRKEP